MIAFRTQLARLAVAAVIAVGIIVGTGGWASAHDVLISSDPADGSTVKTTPSTVSFTFDQPVQNFDPVVSLVGPDGRQYATGTPQIQGNVVTGEVTSGPAGAYTAAFRIVSADGHPVTGEVRYTLAAGAAPATGAGASGSAASAGATTSFATSTPAVSAVSKKSGGLSTGIWIGLIVAVLVIAAAAVILLRRPSGSRPDRDY